MLLRTLNTRFMRSISVDASGSVSAKARRKPRVVVAGSGWGGFALAKQLNPEQFDITIVSPRNHLLFTPLLASTTTGVLEFRSIAEPIRYSMPYVAFQKGKMRHGA